MKKTLTLFLALCLLLTACGTAAAPVSPPAAELLPDTAYRLQSYALEEGLLLPRKVCRAGDSLYFITQSAAGAPSEELARETALYRLLLTDGTWQKLAVYPAESSQNSDSFTAVADIFPGEDGTVWVMENTTHYIFDLPKNYDPAAHDKWEYYQYRGDTTHMRQLSEAGEELHSFTLTNLQSSLNAALQAGEYLLCAQGQTLLALTPDGQTVHSVTAPGWITSVAKSGDTVCLLTDHEADKTCRLYRLDLQTMTLDEGTALPTAIYTHAGLLENTLYYTDRGSVFAWDLFSGSGKKLLDWQDHDRDRSHIGAVFALEDGRLAALSQQSPEKAAELLVLTPDENAANPVPTLTLGVLFPDDNTLPLVLSFNALKHGGRVRVADYSEYEALGQSGVDRLRLDLASGAAPDLLFSPDSRLSVPTVAPHQLRDLSPYLEKDLSLKQQGLMPSVFDALRQDDGKLYSVASAFHLHTAVGRSDLIPTPFDVPAALDAAEQLQSDGFAPIEPYMTRESVLSEHLFRLSDTYFSASEANLAQDLFYNALTLSARYPEALDWKKYEKKGLSEPWYRVRSGSQLYLSGTYSRFHTLAEDLSAVGANAVLCGFPDVPGAHVLEIWESWGITTACRDAAAAWTFLRTVLTEQYQTSYTLSGLPTNRAAFSRLGRNAMQGGTVSQRQAGKELIEVSSQLTEAQYDALLQAVDSAKVLARPLSEGLASVIYRAAADYYTGSATAEEAASAAQMAANLLLSTP